MTKVSNDSVAKILSTYRSFLSFQYALLKSKGDINGYNWLLLANRGIAIPTI